MNETRLAILEYLRETQLVIDEGMWLTPTSIALHIGTSPNNVNQQIGKLRETGLLETHPEKRGYYRITDYACEYLDGAVPASELED